MGAEEVIWPLCSTSLTWDLGSNPVVTEILDGAVRGETANQIQTGQESYTAFPAEIFMVPDKVWTMF